MTGPSEPGGKGQENFPGKYGIFSKISPKLHSPSDSFHFAGFLPSKFFPHFASYRQTLATPTQFLTVILAQTARTFGGMSAVDV